MMSSCLKPHRFADHTRLDCSLRTHRLKSPVLGSQLSRMHPLSFRGERNFAFAGAPARILAFAKQSEGITRGVHAVAVLDADASSCVESDAGGS
jgi:hypothetical protein